MTRYVTIAAVMGITAIAALQISPSSLAGRFGAALPDPEGAKATPSFTSFTGRHGMPFGITDLKDGVLVWTRMNFDAEPDELALGVRLILGGMLDAHEDPRGLFFFPDVAKPTGKTYREVLEEVGELGSWTQKVSADYLPKRYTEAQQGSPEAALRDMRGALPPEALSQLDALMASGDLSSLQSMLGGSFPQGMQGFAGMPDLQSMDLSNPQLQHAMSEMMQQLGGAGGLEGLTSSPLFQQMLSQVEMMQQQSPEQFAALERQMSALMGGMSPASNETTDKNDPPTKK